MKNQEIVWKCLACGRYLATIECGKDIKQSTVCSVCKGENLIIISDGKVCQDCDKSKKFR